MSRSGHLVEKDDLLAAVWPDTVVEENNLAHNINALRKALGDAKLIETVPGKGYRFIGTAHPAAPAPAPGAVETPSDAPVLIERDDQMKSLQEAFAAVLGGKRQFVCIPGEAGVGKTTLFNAFLQERSPHVARTYRTRPMPGASRRGGALHRCPGGARAHVPRAGRRRSGLTAVPPRAHVAGANAVARKRSGFGSTASKESRRYSRPHASRSSPNSSRS